MIHFRMTRRTAVSAVLAMACCCAAVRMGQGRLMASPVQLNAPGTTLGPGRSFAVSHDNRLVSFALGDAPYTQAHAVPIAGGESYQVSSPLPDGEWIFDVYFSADDSHILYRTRGSGSASNDLQHLFSVPAAGGTALELAASPLSYWFEISPQGNHVVGSSPDRDEFFSVPWDGGPAVHVPGYAYGFTPDGQQILYFHGALYAPGELFRIDPNGQNAVHVASLPAFSLSVVPTADSRFAVFNDSTGLRSVPIQGGPVETLSLPNQGILGFVLTADSRHAVFVAGTHSLRQYDVYSAPVTGGSPIRLNEPLPTGRYPHHYITSPDSANVVYSITQAIAPCAFGVIEVSELYRVPVQGGIPIRLSESIDSSFDNPRTIRDPQFTSDGSRAVWLDGYLGCEGPQNLRLLSAPIDGGQAVELSFSLDSGAYGVRGFQLSPDGQWAVFVQHASPSDNFTALYAVPVYGGAPIRLSSHTPPGGSVDPNSITFSSDSRYLVYTQFDRIDLPGGAWSLALNLYSVPMPLVPEPGGEWMVLLLAMAGHMYRRGARS